jgi:hypothetical protein
MILAGSNTKSESVKQRDVSFQFVHILDDRGNASPADPTLEPQVTFNIH